MGRQTQTLLSRQDDALTESNMAADDHDKPKQQYSVPELHILWTVKGLSGTA